MVVDYSKFAKTFAHSRKKMKWPELEYFFSLLQKNHSILDLACGSGRLLQAYFDFFGCFPETYIGIDISEDLLTEARNDFPNQKFSLGDMSVFSSTLGGKKFEAIFCIAGFHHLESENDREKALQQMKQSLTDTGRIYMTNWSLHTPKNLEKYKTSQRAMSQNIFGSYDYDIKIGEHTRYYHSFSLLELKHLSEKVGFRVGENRLFDSERNTITILEK